MEIIWGALAGAVAVATLVGYVYKAGAKIAAMETRIAQLERTTETLRDFLFRRAGVELLNRGFGAMEEKRGGA